MMATMQFKVPKEFDRMMDSLGNLYDDACEDVLNAGAAVVARALKGTKFGKYVKIKKPKKNKFGWFAQVQFRGKTKSGASAGLAATVHEYGRGGNNPQPARPEIRAKVRSVEDEAVDAMQNALEAKLNEHSQ